ncbi:acyl-CoA synthetase [Nocardia sp. NPDC051030]|uniref:acyl-CoA synthetase n=1 Tax=Nocardia sp. NPDC051030 TaxID=3155162 RepID=UPI00341A6C42
MSIVRRAWDEAQYLRQCVKAGVLTVESPRRIARMAAGVRRFGLIGGGLSVAAERFGDRAALIDELGSVSFAELDGDTNALANAWRARGLRAGDGVAILIRNHRGFHRAVFAAAKCGARIILLNTDFAGPQIREVAEREGTDLLVHDDEYTELLGDLVPRFGRYRAWMEAPGADTLDALIAASPRDAPPKPTVPPRIILLTSGTTGTPKGAPRPEPRSLAPLGMLLERAPFRAGEVTVCAAPMFHTLGFTHAVLAVTFGSTLVVRRRFDPAATLAGIAEHRASALIVVPIMLRRLLDLGDEARARLDLSCLRVIVVAGSALGADLCVRATTAFGPVVYNVYGSTEVAYASIATPDDLAVAPGCVGRPVRGAVVRIVDDRGIPQPTGLTGRIFVGNAVQAEGYTGGGGKEMLDGLMSSGDVGHFDAAGRLFVDGRDDEMIVSGGENVFPAEVEELLAQHDSILEAAALGIPDDYHGQRLRAFVVLRPGASLTEQDVREYVRAHLARFKVPRDVVFLDRLPRNTTGKVLKRVLLEP